VLTVTRDMILPTHRHGLLPAGRCGSTAAWRDDRSGRRWAIRYFREQYLDAVASIIAEQEAAGLDIVTDGDSRFDLTVGGKSWFFLPDRASRRDRGPP